MACAIFAAELATVISKADSVTGLVTPLMTATTDRDPARAELSEIKTMRDALEGFTVGALVPAPLPRVARRR